MKAPQDALAVVSSEEREEMVSAKVRPVGGAEGEKPLPPVYPASLVPQDRWLFNERALSRRAPEALCK